MAWCHQARLPRGVVKPRGAGLALQGPGPQKVLPIGDMEGQGRRSTRSLPEPERSLCLWRLQNPPKPNRAFSWWLAAHWSRRALLPMFSTSTGHQQRVELEILLLQGKIISHSQHLGEPGDRIQGDRCSGYVAPSGLVSPPSRAGYVQRSLNKASKVSVQCSSLPRDCPEFASSSWQCSPEQAELSKARRPPQGMVNVPLLPRARAVHLRDPGSLFEDFTFC